MSGIRIELSDLFVRRIRDLFRQQGLTREEVDRLFQGISACRLRYHRDAGRLVVEIPEEEVPADLREGLAFLEDGLKL